ncbi:MAG: acyl-CoA thioesterase [Frankiaceae bacterium]|nr:acyl-CoA thioesterase [Frankiaceae bacterium]
MRWADMDAQGHVNNTELIAYIEQARVSAFFDPEARSLDRGVVVARHEIDYLRPITYSQTPLDIQLWIERVRAASFLVRCEVRDHGHLAARTLSSVATVNLATGRPRRMNPAERDLVLLYHDDDTEAGDPAAGGDPAGGGDSLGAVDLAEGGGPA